MFDRIIRLSIGNPVFVNLLWIVIVLAGFISARRLPVEQFPEVSLDRVNIEVVYPGATAADVEELVTRPIEEGLEDVADVKEIDSISAEGRATINITFLQGKDLQEARSDVEKAVSAVDDLPEDAEAPIVRELVLELPVVSLAIVGDNTLTRETDRLVDELTSIAGVASVNVSGLAERKFIVELDQRKLLGSGLVPEHVVAAIRAAKANVPAGEVRREGKQVFVKTERNLQSAADVARIPARPGSTLRIGDLGVVRDVHEEPDTVFYVNGQPAIKLTVGRAEEADPLGLSDAIEARFPRLRQELPPGTEIVVADDFTLPIRDRLQVVAWNAATGAVLVLGVLLLLSGMRQALLALWGMPISYFMATLLMDQTGITVNVVSTFGLLIATGIIVDDAIVVIENVQRHMEMGKTRLEATFIGTREVLLPVTVAVATTMCAFLPLTMVSGTMGRVMAILPLVVIFCLIGSLIEAMFILPGHLKQHARVDPENSRTARLARALRASYRPTVAFCARHRYVTVLATFVAFAGVAGLASTMSFEFGAPGKPFELRLNWELPPGSGKEPTEAYGREMLEFVAERLPEGSVGPTTLRVGSTLDQRSGFVSTGANLGSIRWEFDVDDPFLEAYPSLIEDLRGHLQRDPLLASFFLEEVQAGPPAGAAVTARLRGRDIEEINRAVLAVKQTLADMEGITDIRDNYGSGKETWRIDVDPDRASLYGFTPMDVGRTLRTAVDGTVAIEVSIAEEPVEILVRYAGGESTSRNDLDNLLLPSATRGLVRLDAIAEVTRTREVGFIRREDGLRTVSVLADVVPGKATALQAAQDLEKHWEDELSRRFPGITLAFGGEADELRESLADLPAAFGLALALIYTLLALQFGSYLQPIIIMSAVPFGLMGAITGLFAMGYPLSLMALFGIVALAGICVNDSLVMIDVINQLRSEGRSAIEAAIEGAVQRFRPILSTTLTTCLGLLPLAIGLGGKDEVLAPMGVSIAAGLGVATALILIAVPPIYLIVEDIRSAVRRPRQDPADN